MPPKTTQPPLLDFEDEATLFSLSSEFLAAAKTLIETPVHQTNCATVAYFLVGHAAELLLKSFLFNHGVTIDDLRKRYGHDLGRLVKLARIRGLPAMAITTEIQRFSGAYNKKRMEYRKMTILQLPPLELLFEEIVGLQRLVFNRIARFDSEG